MSVMVQGHPSDQGRVGSSGCVSLVTVCVWWLKTPEWMRSHVERAGSIQVPGRDLPSRALDRVDSGAILLMGNPAGM